MENANAALWSEKETKSHVPSQYQHQIHRSSAELPPQQVPIQAMSVRAIVEFHLEIPLAIDTDTKTQTAGTISLSGLKSSIKASLEHLDSELYLQTDEEQQLFNPEMKFLPGGTAHFICSHATDSKKSKQKQACLSCRLAKVHCTGNIPCKRCLSRNEQCIFSAPRKRGRKMKTAEESSSAKLQKTNASSPNTSTTCTVPSSNSAVTNSPADSASLSSSPALEPHGTSVQSPASTPSMLVSSPSSSSPAHMPAPSPAQLLRPPPPTMGSQAPSALNMLTSAASSVMNSSILSLIATATNVLMPQEVPPPSTPQLNQSLDGQMGMDFFDETLGFFTDLPAFDLKDLQEFEDQLDVDPERFSYSNPDSKFVLRTMSEAVVFFREKMFPKLGPGFNLVMQNVLHHTKQLETDYDLVNWTSLNSYTAWFLRNLVLNNNIDANPDPVAIWSTTGVLLFFNLAMYRLVKWKAVDVFNKDERPNRGLFHIAHLEDLLRLMQNQIAILSDINKNQYQMTLRLFDQQGKEIQTVMHAETKRNCFGLPILFVGYFYGKL